MIDVDVEVLAQQLDAGVRDPFANENARTQTVTGCSYASKARVVATPRSISAAEFRQRELHGGERGGDVEDVEVADVSDAEDLSLQRALARRQGDAVPVAQ